MRVLHYIDADNITWLTSYMKHIKTLEAFGIKNIFMCRPGHAEKCARENEIETYTFKPFMPSVPLLSFEFKRFIEKIKPDLIHTCLSSSAAIAGFWGHYLKIPVVSAFNKSEKPKYYSNSNYYVACAEWLKDYMVNAQNFPPEKISIISNPVDTEFFQPDLLLRDKFRQELGLAEDEILIAGMGFYTEQKGFDVLIKACENLNVTLVLIGTESTEKGMREKYDFLAKSHNVNLIMPAGFVKDVRGYLQASDVFVMPSRAEGFSMALLEALASGLPVVVSDIEPFQEIITNNFNGFIAKKDDVKSFTANIEKALALSLNERGKMISHALELVRSKFTHKAAAEKTISLYRKVLSSARENKSFG